MKTIIFSILSLLVAGPAWSQTMPTILSVSGDVEEGEIVTIVGFGFGRKENAAPLRFDRFDNGTVGDVIPDQYADGWSRQGDNGSTPRYADDHERYPGDLSVLQDYSVAQNQAIGLTGIDAGTLYVSGWTYRDDFEGTAGNCDNASLAGYYFGSGGDNGRYPVCDDRYDFVRGSSRLYTQTGPGVNIQSFTGNLDSRFGRWVRFERYIDIGDPGIGNGETWISYDGEVVEKLTGAFWTGGDPYDSWYIGHFFKKSPPSPDMDEPSLKVFWSELYVDVTQARVELGDAPVFEECTHREIQYPRAWSADTLEIEFRTGSLSESTLAYLFVVNADGKASAGWPFGEGIPGQPGTPMVRP